MPKPRRKYPLLVLVGRSAELGRLEQALHRVDGSPGAFTAASAKEAADYLTRRAGHKGRPSAPLPLMLILDAEVPGGKELLKTLEEHPSLRYVVPLVLTPSPKDFRLERPGLVLPKPGSPADCERLARRVRGLLPDRAL